MVCGGICMADGSIACMRTGGLSVVPALAPAVRAVGLDGADHYLDSEHHPNLLRLAFAHAWSSVAGSWLDYAAGIRMRRDGRCNHPVAPDHSTGRATVFNRLAALGVAAHQNFANIPVRIVKPLRVITTSMLNCSESNFRNETMTTHESTAAQTKNFQDYSKGGHHDPSHWYATRQQAGS